MKSVLYETYKKEIVPALKEKRGYTNPMQIPKLVKIVVNTGVKTDKDREVMTAAVENNYGSTSGAVSVYSNFGRHKIDDGTKVDTLTTDRYFRSKDALTGVSVYQSAQLFDGNRVTVGFDYQHIYGDAYYTNRKPIW